MVAQNDVTRFSNSDLYRANRIWFESRLRVHLQDAESWRFDPLYLAKGIGDALNWRCHSRHWFLAPDGEYVLDPAGHRAVAARNLALGQSLKNLPVEPLKVGGQDYLNLNGRCYIAVDEFTSANPYGPSFLALWGAPKLQGLADVESLRHVLKWAFRPPDSWKGDDERVAAGLPALDATIIASLNRPIQWQRTRDLAVPWTAEVDGEKWGVQLNDYPDEYMYSLLVNGAKAGDFLEWPITWDRGDAELAQQGLRPQEAGPWLGRYLAGEHAVVWNEMTDAGSRIRAEPFFSDALAVARETMRRARANIEILIPRLRQMGYMFIGELDSDSKFEPWTPPNLITARRLRQVLEQRIVPLSIWAWTEQVNDLTLNGIHPKLSIPPDTPDFKDVYPDPLEVRGFDSYSSGEEEILSGTAREKAYDLLGDNQRDCHYRFLVPDDCADFPIFGHDDTPYFVEYIRESFKWGGFPGWKHAKHPPMDEIEFLTNSLVPL